MEVKTKNQKFPIAVFFVLMNILLERYSTTGTSTVLIFYLNSKLGLDQSTSTALWHINEFSAYFFPILGGIIADSYWGLFKTLAIMSFVFASGSAILAFGGVDTLNLPTVPFTIVGLLLIVIGSGSCRANLTAFGGIQYKGGDQDEGLKFFFIIQLMCLKVGSFTGRFINPIIRGNVQCFDGDCYPLAFGLPSLAMLVSLFVLFCGLPFYVQKPPSDNIFMKFVACIYYGIKGKVQRKKSEIKDHWLDYACVKYDQQMIEDTKTVLKILTVFIPAPIYWSLHQQQGSRWIFQAARTDGDLGWFTLKADQMISLNPIFSIILLPICYYFVFPVFAKMKLDTLLHRIAIGIILGIAAFIVAIIVETYVEKNYISILWLFPQYAILALSENYVLASMLNFAFVEGPTRMKSIMTSSVFATMAFGNLTVTIVSSSKVFERQLHEFIFFVAYMCVFLIVFLILKNRYERKFCKNLNVKLTQID